jgi:hypothetical protein
MKNIRHILLPLAAIFVFAACSKIEEPYATVKSVTGDTTKRAVLLEDYTGHLCVNCAKAGKDANDLQELYHGQVFTMAIHAGPFARPSDEYAPYLQANYENINGKEWYNYGGFNILANPSGMVNRRPYNGKISFLPSSWAGAIGVATALPKVAIMTISNSWDNTSKTLNSKVQVRFLESYSGKITLTVCILEDDIINGQLNNDRKTDSVPIIKQYRFMHMLRGSLNGSFGEEIATNPAANSEVSKSYSNNLSDKPWVFSNCSVLAFISDDNTKEVLHVAKTAFTK